MYRPSPHLGLDLSPGGLLDDLEGAGSWLWNEGGTLLKNAAGIKQLVNNAASSVARVTQPTVTLPSSFFLYGALGVGAIVLYETIARKRRNPPRGARRRRRRR
jgi:hypothetical protein